ncbi:MAG: FABP family protein, partial [bacterium]
MIEKLSLLIGAWKGKGKSNYPTIETTEYIEELEFRFIGDDESILFEQKTWFNINGVKGNPLHWESGFIIAYPDDTFELFNAQNSKRVEVMKSSFIKIEETKLQLSFESKYFGNDERMVKTSRDFFVD